MRDACLLLGSPPLSKLETENLASCTRSYNVAGVSACHTRLSLVLSFLPMTPHIVTSVGDEHAVSPATSSTPSFVSARSVLSDTAERSPGIQETFLAAESQAKSMDSLVIELSGSTKPQVSTTNPEGNASFIRHHKYFFPDGNITFLVRSTLSWWCTLSTHRPSCM
jgi:hypothetical protein